MFIKKELLFVLVDNDKNRTSNAISESVLTWKNSELKNELKLCQAEIETLLSKFSVSNLKVETLATCLREVVSGEEIGIRNDQKLCSMKLNESLQKLNSLNPNNIIRKSDRREQKISEWTGANVRLVKKVNESLLNEEKLKDEIKDSPIC